MTYTGGKSVLVSELQLGDIITLFEGYGAATVYRINPDSSRQVWRPYVTTSDFEYTGGVIPYIGLEDLALSPTRTVTLLQSRDNPLK